MPRTLETGHGTLITCHDFAELSATAAGVFMTAATSAVRDHGRFMVALSGGKTPVGMYRELVRQCVRIPWDKTYLFWSDERCVPADDPESNYGFAERELLRHIPVPPERIFRMQGELEPQRAAAEYERAMREVFQLAPGKLPRFDLMLLGMGDEGHIASLFPGSEALAAQRLAAAPYVESKKMYRLTLTLPVINDARATVVLVSGEAKAEALAKAIRGPDEHLPAQLLRPVNGTLTWIADESAASRMQISSTKERISGGAT